MSKLPRAAIVTMTAAVGLATATTSGQVNPNLTFNPGLIDTDDNMSTGDGWFTFGAASAELDFFGDGNIGHGSFFADMAGNSGGLFQLGIPAVAGETYELNFRAQFEANYDAVTRFGLEFYEADDETKIGETFVEIDDAPVAGGYRRYTMQAVAPAGTAFVSPVMLFEESVGNGADRGAPIGDILVHPGPCHVLRRYAGKLRRHLPDWHARDAG